MTKPLAPLIVEMVFEDPVTGVRVTLLRPTLSYATFAVKIGKITRGKEKATIPWTPESLESLGKMMAQAMNYAKGIANDRLTLT